MDPLSVIASIVGILAAGSKVTSLLFAITTKYNDSPPLARSIIWEVADISASLGHLQSFIQGRINTVAERGDLILLDQLLTTLTGCVTTYSDLHLTLTSLNINEDMGTFDRIKWMMQESKLNALVQRLQSHKSSLTLMLTIMQCESMEEAQNCTQKLCVLIEQMLESNRDLAERIRGLERQGSIISKTRSKVISEGNTPSIHRASSAREGILQSQDTPVKRFAFEDDLESSRVYNKAFYRFSQLSITSTDLYTTALSIFSKLSLAQVSHISFYALPLCAVDINNSEFYTFGEKGAVLPDPLATFSPLCERPERPEVQDRQLDCAHEPAPKPVLTAAAPATANPSLQSTKPPPGNETVGLFQSLRVRMDDPCYKVLPTALRKYQITGPWVLYDLFIVYDDVELCLELHEKPLILFKQLEKRGKNPMFMLRKKNLAPGDIIANDSRS